MTSSATTVTEMAAQLAALGLRKDDVVLVHTSFRAMRPIEGGPHGVIDAVRTAIGPHGTIVMPSWGADDETPFDPATTEASAALGAGRRSAAAPFRRAAAAIGSTPRVE